MVPYSGQRRVAGVLVAFGDALKEAAHMQRWVPDRDRTAFEIEDTERGSIILNQ
jgi:hypothetical protein